MQKKYQNAVDAFKDGFVYVVVIYCYGSRSSKTFYNNIACNEELDYWYGDNGIARCITNNPKFKISSNTRALIIDENPIEKAKDI